MLIFPNAKINLGLHVTEKRKDGFHNIETIFYPIDWCDALEVIETKNKDLPFEMSMSGLSVLGDVKSNLIYKAWEQLAQLKNIPPLSVHLHKHIPMGAGLGGGSADGAFFLNLMNSQFDLNLTETTLISIANSLGSDCAFFLKNQPVIATQKGNVFSEIKIDLSKYFILIVFPSIHSNTKDAYDGITPQFPIIKLEEIIETVPIEEWKHHLVNDFENSIFKKFPEVKMLKENLYAKGALYASMSGSGSAVFGIFENEPAFTINNKYLYCLQKPSFKTL